MAPCNDLSSGKLLYNATLFDDLSDDVLGNILVFCPFPSAVQFACCTCKNLRHRSGSMQLSRAWKILYDRQGFFPPEEGHDEIDYLMLGTKKRQLLSNVMQKRSPREARRNSSMPLVPRRFPWVGQMARRACSNFRDRSRYWCPIWKASNSRQGLFPQEEQHDSARYSMRSGQRRNRVIENQSSDAERQHSLSFPDHYFHFMPLVPSWIDAEHDLYAMMLPRECHGYKSFAMMSGGICPALLLLNPFDGSLSVLEASFRWSNQGYADTQSNESTKITIADGGETVHDSRYQQLRPPTERLLQEVDVISTYSPHHGRGWTTEDLEVGHVGVEATPIWQKSNLKSYELEGYLVGEIRCVRNPEDYSIVCTEFSTWTRSAAKEATFGNRRLCRFPFIFQTAEVDACHLRVLVWSFVYHDKVTHHTISVYPLIDWQGENDSQNYIELYFPKSIFSIDCQDTIATFSLDAIGETVLVATKSGVIEIWRLGLETAHREQILHLLSQPSWITELEWSRRIFLARNDGSLEFRTFSNGRGQEFVENPFFPAFHQSINKIFVPNHLPVQRSGFLTLHDNREGGRSLLLWKSVENSWDVVCLIHLDISRFPSPWITYDGHRIIVFGEDSLGSIILIFQVMNCDSFADHDGDRPMGEASKDGVYNMVNPPVVRFANRIRHAALGGFDRFDSLHMICNERFIIVNTRRGNQLGTSAFPDGLLIIDLEQRGPGA